MWAIDVYQGSLSSVTLLLALAPKRSILGFWMHQWQSIWNQSFLNAILWFSALSMVIGAFGAFSQVHLKRFLAYSSVGNMGILRMAFGSGSGAEAALWTHFALYALTSLAVWGILMLPFIRQGKVYSNPTYLWDFAVLWKTHPMTAWTFGLAMTSLAGLPPLAGFLGKLGIFWWSLNSGQYALLAVALTTTLIGRVYYLRLRRIMYMDQPKEWTVAGIPSTSAAYVIAFSGLSLIVLRWYSSPILRTTHWLSLSLFCV
jgi:NADH-quinone oxidoreductase subunit N